ncbi:Pre-mRNA-splicing factor SYF1 [Mycena venus]|uniref:Pre-mRNA-splicing factor SYF1 n=1 Tax=Mycena venus TaxID=2733690 RepID=A0A8H6XDU8_9AGAR|nr:Pre-mRNA-splicing factor SYF1 [Mycena venus]
MWLPLLPRLWLMYLSIFSHPLCPSILSYTHGRHTYDRALRTLPPSLHSRIWVRYLLWSEAKGGATTVAVYRRYLAVDPSITEHFTTLLLSPANSAPRPLEAAKLLLSLARKAARGEYVSPEGKSPYQLLGDWLDVVEKFSEEVGLDVDETVDSNAAHAKADAEAAANDTPDPVSVDGKLIRFVGPAVPVTSDGQTTRPYDEDEDPTSPRKLNIERIIQTDGLAQYKDQAGRLWTGLATYWIKRGEFDRAKQTFEQGIATVLTIRDFTQIFDAYAEFGESLISAMMQSLEDEEDEEDAEETQKELDVRMADFEDLMDRRPFLVNDVLIRRNPHDVQEWEKRVALWGDDDEKVAATYTTALETIVPRKATANLHRLYVNFAKFYEEGGTAGQAEPDLDSARKILEKGTKVNFKAVEDLAEVWCEWAEMEIRHENYDDAIRVMQRAAAIPKNTKINYHDHSLSAQTRLFKSLKLWSFYVDLEESIGAVETTKAVYDKILELRIANAQIIINYAAFLEENKYFEESFKVYERGVELFTFPVSFEIWNIYLSKFVKRYGGSKLERARDLFEQALEKCPPKSSKPLFLMYAKLEERTLGSPSGPCLFSTAQLKPLRTRTSSRCSLYILRRLQPTTDSQPLGQSMSGLSKSFPTAKRPRCACASRHWSVNWVKSTVRAQSTRTLRNSAIRELTLSSGANGIRSRLRLGRRTRSGRCCGSSVAYRHSLILRRATLPRRPLRRSKGTRVAEQEAEATDAMAAAEKAAGPAFVAAKQTALPRPEGEANDGPAAPAANADEIHISDDEDL